MASKGQKNIKEDFFTADFPSTFSAVCYKNAVKIKVNKENIRITKPIP